MSNLTIITNGHSRPIVYGWELSRVERREFDCRANYEVDNLEVVRYRGCVYDLDWFDRAPKHMAPWDGILTETYFSGVLLAWAKDEAGSVDYSRVIMGRYYS